MANRALTVSEITARVKSVLEDSLEMGWVIGEVSDFSRASSGHCYWTLRDESSQISCVMFRFYARELTFIPEPGVQLLVYGNVSVYERGGRYQLHVYWVQPVGVGEMAVAFERLRDRLAAEGLFAEERKKPLPRFPRCVGVVTSASGAAIRDILQIVQRRSPGVQIVLRPTRVQGPGAAEAIANGIADLNAHSDADLLIVGRGGGSPEDLWPFNEELVARAIHNSRLPVVSAVGHEIDYTIADYAADLRAPTPSAAAELATPDQMELRREVAARTRALLAGKPRTPRRIQEALGRPRSRAFAVRPAGAPGTIGAEPRRDARPARRRPGPTPGKNGIPLRDVRSAAEIHRSARRLVARVCLLFACRQRSVREQRRRPESR